MAIEIITQFAQSLIINHPYLVSFFGPLLGGEPVFVFLAFISSQGILPLWILFIGGTIADILDDIFWFYVPRWKISKKIKIPRFFSKKYNHINKKFKRFEKKELPFFILASKFFIGARNIAIISISLNKIKFKNFIKYSIISAIIWSSIIITVGYFAGKGFFILQELFNNLRKSITVIIIIIIVLIIIRYYFHKLSLKIISKKSNIKS